MVKTKIALLSLSALAGVGVVEVGEHAAPKPEALTIPYKAVGDSVSMQRYPHSPVIECTDILSSDTIDIDAINACATKRVGWLKL